jgi:hypothetical protein
MVMSALPPKADICSALAYVCFGPIADIRAACVSRLTVLGPGAAVRFEILALICIASEGRDGGFA